MEWAVGEFLGKGMSVFYLPEGCEFLFTDGETMTNCASLKMTRAILLVSHGLPGLHLSSTKRWGQSLPPLHGRRSGPVTTQSRVSDSNQSGVKKVAWHLTGSFSQPSCPWSFWGNPVHTERPVLGVLPESHWLNVHRGRNVLFSCFWP